MIDFKSYTPNSGKRIRDKFILPALITDISIENDAGVIYVYINGKEIFLKCVKDDNCWELNINDKDPTNDSSS